MLNIRPFFVFLVIPVAVCTWRRPRVVQLQTLRERIIWTVRSWLWDYPVPLDTSRWQLSDPENTELYGREARTIIHAWKFLRPFFASHGYTLYRSQPPKIFDLLPAPVAKPTESHVDFKFPYARRIYEHDEEIMFPFVSLRVWPARDEKGRDVVIRLVSGREPSDELKIIQRLNTDRARADPRNHSIRILEYIYFDGLVFIVMPRWDQSFNPDFHTVAELFHFTETFLEAFDFLHEYRIAHTDFLEQNTGINVLVNTNATHLTGLRDLSSTRYAIFDFGGSSIYPEDTVIEDVRSNEFFNFRLRGYETPPGPCNPFEVDILFLGCTLERWVRHIVDIVPTIGPFFDSMVTSDTSKRFTARQALEEFKRIRSSSSPSQLNSLVTNRFWNDGVVGTKVQFPTKLRLW
ncbi:hypothetical protein BDZ94DRAFT_1272858 [Collybia nuda]|uniref:Protein kinase domain-containing protein n=1 Tax=Collybia nuda TaxID=64659 RepID=A0A9P5XXL5_9AGAR|nr:hypothetical protein BDZ94DRAFT_1272858 [Collybia nuda]